MNKKTYKYKTKRDSLPVVVWLKSSLSRPSHFILTLQDVVVVKIHNDLLTVH